MRKAAIPPACGGDAASLWHVCWQAAVGRDFFGHPALPPRIRERLLQAHQDRGRVLIDYLILPGEIHVLCALPDGEGPGDVARAIGNVVSRWVRQTHPVRSPVLAGPHLSYRIPSLDELRQDVRMLAWRPVKLGLCRRPNHHRHGGLRIALGLTPVQGFDSRCVLQLFGPTIPQARAVLRGWVASRPCDRTWREWELVRGLSFALGSVGTQPQMAREVRAPAAAALVAAGGNGIDGALEVLGAWVARRLGLPGLQVLREGADALSARGRALVACLAVRHQLCSAAAVARHFGRAKATLSEQMTACRQRPADREILAASARRITEEAQALGERSAGVRQHRSRRR